MIILTYTALQDQLWLQEILMLYKLIPRYVCFNQDFLKKSLSILQLQKIVHVPLEVTWSHRIWILNWQKKSPRKVVFHDKSIHMSNDESYHKKNFIKEHLASNQVVPVTPGSKKNVHDISRASTGYFTSSELTYPTWRKGTSSTQKCLFGEFVSSQEGMPFYVFFLYQVTVVILPQLLQLIIEG